MTPALGPAAASPITGRILGFCEALRKNGVRAAEQEVIDCFRAVAVVGEDALVDRESLLAVLTATLAKSASEEEILARVFALHFGFALDTVPAATLASLLRDRGLGDDDIAALLRELDSGAHGEDENGDIDALLRALLEGDADRLTELVREGLEDSDLEGLQSPLQIAYFTSRLLMRLGQTGVDERLLRARAAFAERDGPRDRAAASAMWDLGERLRRSARRAVELELEKRTVAKPARTGSLLDRDLRANMDAQEAMELRRLVRRLAEKLKARLLVRRRRARRGRIDVRRMLRTSVATDAIPMRVHLQRKRPQKPDVMILCDVSDSVRQASLFMLELVGAVSDVLRRARSFVFVDRIGEVTELFQSGGDPVAAILGGDVVPVGANSDYGKAFRAFWDRCGGQLTRRTTVVILGDGRNNYRPPEDWVLDEVRKRSRRVLWLSPEDRPTWGFGDSEMIRYARHADAIFVVRSASDLARAIDRIAR